MADRINTFDRQEGTSNAWHHKTIVKDRITLSDNWLRQWDIVPVVLQKYGQDTKYRVLECTDETSLEVGTAYNSETYRPINNTEFLNLIEASVAGTDAEIVSVGSVRNRGRVFVSLKLAGHEKFEVAGHKFNAYLNFGNGHDKSSVLWVNTSNIDTVCDNTFSCNLFAVENARKVLETAVNAVAIRQRHTINAKLRFPAVARLIDAAVGAQSQFAVNFGKFDAIALSEKEAREIFAGLISRDVAPLAVKEGLSNRGVQKTDRLVDLFLNGRGNRGATLADAFSAVTDFYTHESVRGIDKARQFASSEFESGALVKQEFYNLAQQPVKLEATRAHGEALLLATK
jgi:uncharacterized protein DUF932